MLLLCFSYGFAVFSLGLSYAFDMLLLFLACAFPMLALMLPLCLLYAFPMPLLCFPYASPMRPRCLYYTYAFPEARGGPALAGTKSTKGIMYQRPAAPWPSLSDGDWSRQK